MSGRAKDWIIPIEVLPQATRFRYEGSDSEERRLFYVGMTRARNAIYLSCFERQKVKSPPSRFLTDLVGNSVNIALMGYTAVIPYMNSKALKVLMSVGKARTPVLPDVPTAVEAGFPQLESDTWYGLFAPLATPPEIVESISATVREALKDEGLRKSFATIGGVTVGNTPAEFAAIVRDDAEKWRELVRRFPIQQ
jgi:tripartite-type tricarboxylate transporter receptor subunit TctC